MMFQCSSASRKFLNSAAARPASATEGQVSVLFSEPKIPQLSAGCLKSEGLPTFQCSSASRKFLNYEFHARPLSHAYVSVLFSEPKIPQSTASPSPNMPVHAVFQCSSASRKFLNALSASATGSWIGRSFSALQRAENSSISLLGGIACRRPEFQCSSASRKFLNVDVFIYSPSVGTGFSALQRAENSSI